MSWRTFYLGDVEEDAVQRALLLTNPAEQEALGQGGTRSLKFYLLFEADFRPN